jgi:hypothetical protein
MARRKCERRESGADQKGTRKVDGENEGGRRIGGNHLGEWRSWWKDGRVREVGEGR